MTSNHEQLEEEVQRLKAENKALQEQNNKPKKKMSGCLIAFIVVGGMVALFMILSIGAAVALPMYSKFQKKAKFSHAVKSASDNKAFLGDWYEKISSFEGIGVPTRGGSLICPDETKGGFLATIPGLSWQIESDKDTILIRFAYENCQGDPHCSGFVMAEDQGDGTLAWTVYDAEENLQPNP